MDKENWISIDERIPDSTGWYLAVRNGETMTEYFYKGEMGIGHWTWDELYRSTPTHWQPLPEPPTEEK
jgi:hypothetical protein